MLRRWCSGRRRPRPPAGAGCCVCPAGPGCCVYPRVFRAPEGPAAVCAGGRRPAREPPALRASLGASSRSPARPRHRPWVPPPGPVGQLGRLSETAIAFAGAGRALSETAVTFARSRSRGIETVIAFAGEKWAFLVQFFGCRGDAGFKAPLLEASSGVVGFNVATLSRLAREKARPAALCHRESAKKFALRAHNGPKSAFSGVLGEFFCGNAAGGAVLGELFRARGPRRGPARPRRQLLRPERSGLKPRDLALHSGRVSAKIVVSTPTWRVIRPPVR